MAIIDDVDFHLSDEQRNSEDMSDGMLIPMGIFLVWAASRSLLSEACLNETDNFLAKVISGEFTVRDVVDFDFDGKLHEYQVTKAGLEFSNKYYITDLYLKDLREEFKEAPSEYNLPDTKDTLERGMAILDRRFSELMKEI